MDPAQLTNPLIRRAVAAYLRTDNGVPGMADLREHDGRQYVSIADGGELLAVYRVRVGGQLKRLRRWPAELAG